MNAVRHVRIFKNGRSRAVRIPKDFDFFGDELVMRQVGERLILERVEQRPTLAQILEEWRNEPPIDEEWPEIDDPPPEPVTDFDD